MPHSGDKCTEVTYGKLRKNRLSHYKLQNVPHHRPAEKRFFFSLPRFQQDPDLYPGRCQLLYRGAFLRAAALWCGLCKSRRDPPPRDPQRRGLWAHHHLCFSGFISSYQNENYDLNYCFKKARRKSPMSCAWFFSSQQTLRSDLRTGKIVFGCGLCRWAVPEYPVSGIYDPVKPRNDPQSHRLCQHQRFNPKILALLDFLNTHLTEDISIDRLSEQFYISKYYLMHSFKEETGYTIGNYLTTRRLLRARDLIRDGSPITEACFASGFKNYSSFSRAYKKYFKKAPRDLWYGCSTGLFPFFLILSYSFLFGLPDKKRTRHCGFSYQTYRYTVRSDTDPAFLFLLRSHRRSACIPHPA